MREVTMSFPLLLFILFFFCLDGQVTTTSTSSSSSSSFSSSFNNLTDDVVLASEETPTRAPHPVTRQGLMTDTNEEDVQLITDCSEPLNKDISCSVHIVGCSDPIFPFVEAGKEPPEPHDVRIAPTTKVMGANHIDKRKHSLHVDVSWQIPQLEEVKYLKAFKLLVRDPDGKNTCFVFNVTQSAVDATSSPRYRFSSNTLFDFGTMYTITIVSLPVSKTRAPRISASTLMPDDPDEAPSKMTQEEICMAKSNPQASKWAASFRKIFLFSAIQMIQIEFLAAPPQYCFEEYEVRLLDSSGIIMVQSAVISREDLRTEMIDGRPIQFGEYNFTDIEMEVDLIPSVIPIETSREGKCLCETGNGCSCLAADWKAVKLKKAEPPPPPGNQTLENNEKSSANVRNGGSEQFHNYAILGLLIFVFLCGFLIWFVRTLYKRFQKGKKGSNIHILNENPSYTNAANLPLLLKQNVSVLILYSHDSPQHEAAVLAFAELLRDVFHMNIHLDAWDEDDIETNRADYINSSIVRADKVILINSIGAYYRTAARQLRESALERIVPGLNDNLFLTQIDLALQHPCVISCHFSYTSTQYVMFPLARLLQYTIPESIMTLVNALSGQTARPDQLAGFNTSYARLQSAISRKVHYMETVPHWFESTHHRVVRARQVVDPMPIPLPSCLAIVDKRMEDEQLEELMEKFEQMETRPISEEDRMERIGMMQEDQFRVENEEPDEDLEDEDEEEDVRRCTRLEELEKLIVADKGSEDSGNLDSAYVSGSDFSAELNSEVLDKPRIPLTSDKLHRRDVNDSAFHDDVIGVH